MDQTRKIFQRAICLPLENLEALWQAYNAFENDLNKTTARKFIADKSPVYMQARSALRQLRNILNGVDRNRIPRPPTWTPAERQEVLQFPNNLTYSWINGKLGLNGRERILYC